MTEAPRDLQDAVALLRRCQEVCAQLAARDAVRGDGREPDHVGALRACADACTRAIAACEAGGEALAEAAEQAATAARCARACDELVDDDALQACAILCRSCGVMLRYLDPTRRPHVPA